MKSSFCRAVLGTMVVSLAMIGGAAAVCESPIKHKVVLETSSSLGLPPQVRVATSAKELKSILQGLGIDTGVDLTALIAAGDFISAELGRANQSRAALALAVN